MCYIVVILTGVQFGDKIISPDQTMILCWVMICEII